MNRTELLHALDDVGIRLYGAKHWVDHRRIVVSVFANGTSLSQMTDKQLEHLVFDMNQPHWSIEWYFDQNNDGEEE